MAREASVAQEGLNIFTIYNLPEPTEGDFDALIYEGPTIAEIETFLSSKKISPKSFNNAIIYAIVLKDIIPAKSEQFEEIFKFILQMPDIRFADLKLINDIVQTIIQQNHNAETGLKLQYLNNQALIFMIRANEIDKVYQTLDSIDSIKIQKGTFFHALAFPFIAHIFSEGDETKYDDFIKKAESLITKLFERTDEIIFAPESGFLEHLETESLKQLNDPKNSSLPDYVLTAYLNNKDGLQTLFRNSVTKEANIAR
ncbi:hypothetical protein OAP83_02080 [Rickettsiales bacterium]|nr:hypothetical protein [Rickettsiales bacterium]